MMTEMPFGKYRGYWLSEIPSAYLRWLTTIELYGDLADAVQQELDSREVGQQAPSQPKGFSVPPRLAPMVREIVERGYKASARLFDPDTGGDTAAMQELNAAAEWLRGQVS